MAESKHKTHRQLPLVESHWSFNDFTDALNRAEHGLRSGKGRKKSTWTPDERAIEQCTRLLGCNREQAIDILRAAKGATK